VIRHPDDFSHHFAQLPNIKLHYVREGSGTPIVLCHGWPGFWWEWHMNIGPLAKDFDVIVPDMRGYGDSEKPPLDQIELFHVDHVIDDWAGLLDHLGIQRAYFAGNDWGSIGIHKFLRKYPNRVIKAALFNPIMPGMTERFVSPPHFTESWYYPFQQLDMAVELVSSSRDATKIYFKHFLSRWSHDKKTFSNEELDIYTDNFLKPGNIHGGFNTYRASFSKGLWTQLDRTISDAPVVFIQGMGDPVVRSAWTDLVTNWYTNYVIEYVPDSGHFIMREKADHISQRLKEAFLE
jgi:pimeloyl-ACP methyl ester carboxylesterase